MAQHPNTKAPKRRGRPPKPAGKRRRNNVTIRMTDDVKSRLETAANKASRSLSEEIEARLERSFDPAESDRAAQTGRLVAAVIRAAEGGMGRRWQNDLAVYLAIKTMIDGYFERFKPQETSETELDPDFVSRREFQEAANAALGNFLEKWTEGQIKGREKRK